MKNRVVRKVVAGLLIWLATAAVVALFYQALPWNRWLSLIPFAIVGLAAWLVFRLVRERDPEGGLDSLEVFFYFMVLFMSVGLVMALLFPM